MVKVIGYETKKGTFSNEKTGEVIDYDNINIYTITDQNKNVVGCSSSSIKIKSKEFEAITGCKSPNDLIDKEVMLNYIPIGNNVQLSSISFVK